MDLREAEKCDRIPKKEGGANCDIESAVQQYHIKYYMEDHEWTDALPV